MLIWESQTVNADLSISVQKLLFSGKHVVTPSSSQLTLAVLWDILEAFSECSMITIMDYAMHILLCSFSVYWKAWRCQKDKVQQVHVLCTETQVWEEGENLLHLLSLLGPYQEPEQLNRKWLTSFPMPLHTTSLLLPLYSQVHWSLLSSICTLSGRWPICRISNITTFALYPTSNILLSYDPFL